MNHDDLLTSIEYVMVTQPPIVAILPFSYPFGTYLSKNEAGMNSSNRSESHWSTVQLLRAGSMKVPLWHCSINGSEKKEQKRRDFGLFLDSLLTNHYMKLCFFLAKVIKASPQKELMFFLPTFRTDLAFVSICCEYYIFRCTVEPRISGTQNSGNPVLVDNFRMTNFLLSKKPSK